MDFDQTNSPFSLAFLPQLLEPIGKFIKMDNFVRLVPHMDSRVLISLNLGKELPSDISVNLSSSDVFTCPIEVTSQQRGNIRERG